MNTKEFINGYIECMLWSTMDSEGNFLDESFGAEDVSFDCFNKINADCKRFIEAAGELLTSIDPSSAGHDFWLTRNGHGAGFWDRNMGETGEKLTLLACSFGEFNIYVEDNLIQGE